MKKDFSFKVFFMASVQVQRNTVQAVEYKLWQVFIAFYHASAAKIHLITGDLISPDKPDIKRHQYGILYVQSPIHTGSRVIFTVHLYATQNGIISSALYCNKGIKYESLFSESIGKRFPAPFFFFFLHVMARL